MSDDVKVPYGDSASDTATLLLAAAEEQGLDPAVVRVTPPGLFEVPKEVAKAAGLDTVDPDKEFNAEVAKATKEAERAAADDEPAKAPAKKAAAKKSTTRRES